MNMTPSPESMIIKLYEHIKIIHVDCSDNLLRKYEKKSNEGYLEIILDEVATEIHLILYTLNTDQTKTVHFNIKLSEFDFSNLTGKHIEFRKNRLFELTSFYAIDFSNENDYSDLKSTLYSLKEIYIDEKMESLDDTDFFMVDEVVEKMEPCDETVTYKKNIKPAAVLDIDETPIVQMPSSEELCCLLKKSIQKGDTENAAKYATELANLKVNLDILCIELDSAKPQQQQSYLENPDLNKIYLVFKNRNDKKCQFFMNATTTSILDLKKRVSIIFLYFF